MDYKEGFIICPNNIKIKILEEISSQCDFFNYTFMTLEELKRKLTFNVKKRAVIELSKHLNIKPDVSEAYLDALLMLNGNYNSTKGEFLLKIYNFLNDNNLLAFDDAFKSVIKSAHFTFIDYNESKELKYVLSFIPNENIDLIYPSATLNLKHNTCDIFPNIEDEVAFVFNKIYDLLKKETSIDDIVLCNVSNDYNFIINRVATNYGIPISLTNNDVVMTSSIASKFISMLEEESSFDTIINSLKENDNYLLNKIVDIINSYELYLYPPKDTIPYWSYLFSKISYESKIYNSAIKTIDISDLASYKDKYVFLLNFDINALKILKDERFLLDSECRALGVDDTSYLNQVSKQKLTTVLNEASNLVITFSLMHSFSPAIKSPLIKELNMTEVSHESCYHMGYNKTEDDLYLSKALDDYIKYNDKNSNLDSFYYDSLPYNSYDNKYNGKDIEYLKSSLEKPFILSYTDLHSYLQCPFNYYCKKILKIDKFEPTLNAMLGTYAHAILEDYENQGNDFDFELSSNKALEDITKHNSNYEFQNRDYFYFDKMKNNVRFVIETIKEHKNHTTLSNASCEKKLDVELHNGELVFKGFIDKLWYSDDMSYVAIIDYKTGGDKESLDNLIYGENLQLPVYIYLIKHNDSFKDSKLVGFYLQKINIIIPKKGKETIDEQRLNNLKLEGYTNPDFVELIDDTKGKYLKNYKEKKDGGLYASSKVFNHTEEDMLSKLVEDKIEEAYQGILKSQFKIVAKKIDGKDVSCGYCDFKDVCFKTYDDSVDLAPKKWKEAE